MQANVALAASRDDPARQLLKDVRASSSGFRNAKQLSCWFLRSKDWMHGSGEDRLFVPREKLPIIARNVIGLVWLFAAATWVANARIAAAVVASFVAGYLNEFYIVRSVISLAHGAGVEKTAAVLAMCGVVISLSIVGLGFGMVLLLATGVYLVVDALILRFR